MELPVARARFVVLRASDNDFLAALVALAAAAEALNQFSRACPNSNEQQQRNAPPPPPDNNEAQFGQLSFER